MSRVLGIDYSTRSVDLVFLDEDSEAARWHSIPLEKGLRGIRAIRRAYAWGAALEDVYLVAVEDPMSAGRAQAKKLGRVCGGIVAAMPITLDSDGLWLLRPDEWKLACGLASNAGKREVADWVTEQLPEAVMWSQDAVDAYAIAWAAREINAKAVTNGLREAS